MQSDMCCINLKFNLNFYHKLSILLLQFVLLLFISGDISYAYQTETHNVAKRMDMDVCLGGFLI